MIIIVVITILIIISICLVSFFMLMYKEENVDITFCKGIETQSMRMTCSAIFRQDPFICKKTGNFDKYCYDSVFGSTKNSSIFECEKFSEYYPNSICYLNLAKIKKNPNLCEKVSGMYQTCYWELAKILKNPKLCENINAICEKNQCLAEVTGNISICEEVPDAVEKKTCIGNILKNVNIDQCEDTVTEYPSVLYVPDCVKKIALTSKNISLCNLIENKEIKWSCLAGLSKSIDICEKADSNFWKDYCKVEFIKNILAKG